MKRIILLFASLLFAGVVMAQHRVYLVPIETILVGSGQVRQPKYFHSKIATPNTMPELIGVMWGAMDYGEQNVMLLVADLGEDETIAQDLHETIVSNIDVTGLPEDLDELLSPVAVTKVQNALEAHYLPAEWVNTSYTYRQILKLVCGMFQYMQMLTQNVQISTGKLFSGAITLDTLFNQLPLDVRNAMITAAQNLGLDYSGLTAGSTLRQILRTLAIQWATRNYDLGGIVI